MENSVFRDPNVFCAENHSTSHAQAGPVSIRCPHCRKLGVMNVESNAALAYTKEHVDGGSLSLTASIRMCPNTKCKGLIFVVAVGNDPISVQPPELIEFDSSGIPDRCKASLEEAVACHGAGAYRATGIMVRRLLEEICDENGATGNNLHRRLNSLKSQVVLPQAFFDAMMELKLLGNDATHVEARDYDDIGRSEASDALELVKEVLKALYQLQSIVGRLQARKKSSES